MTKKGPLGKSEIFYIESFHEEKTPQEIAKDLDRAISSVNKVIKKITDSTPPKNLSAGEKLARREGIVMMTETAASIADENRKTSGNTARDCIAKIKKQ